MCTDVKGKILAVPNVVATFLKNPIYENPMSPQLEKFRLFCTRGPKLQKWVKNGYLMPFGA